MPYITVSNSRKIIRNINVEKFNNIVEPLYKWKIYFFSPIESARLKGIRELLRNPSNFAINYYQPINIVDTHQFAIPESQPAYHKDNTCEKLNSDFRNVEIPIAIKEKGISEVEKFRDWFKSIKFEELDVKDFVYKLQLKFPYVGEINPRTVEYPNSGTLEKKNYSLTELENEIDNLLRGAGSYFRNNPDLQPLIRRFQKWTFLAYINKDRFVNNSGLNDDEFINFLNNYEIEFKKPVKELLIEYYRIKFNPEMTFEGTILQQLGFRMCESCLLDNDYVQFSKSNIQFKDRNDDTNDLLK